MVTKEEETVVLLPPEEQQGESVREGNSTKRHTYVASSLSASLLCGTGLFIANIAGWCRDPKEICKDTDVFRFSVLVGGLFSSLFAGRVVDYYGRRSALVSAALCWIVASVFVVFLPSHTEIQVNPYDAPLSHALLWSSPDFSEPSYSSHDQLPSAYSINTFESHVSVSHLFSYSYSQNSSHGTHTMPTEPSAVKSISIQNYSPFIDQKENNNLAMRNLSFNIDPYLEHSQINSMSGIIDSHRNISYFISLLISHVLIGAASAASVIAASVYVCETSRTDSQARWLSLSDFFSSLFILSLPVIHDHMIVLAFAASVPIIILSSLLLIPVNIPSYLSLPRSPQHMLLSYLIQRKKSFYSKSDISDHDQNKNSMPLGKDRISKPSDNFFQTYSDASVGNLKFPFIAAKVKIHDVSSKSSVSDSEESGCFGSDAVLEKRLEKLQTVKIENEGWVNSFQFKQSQLEESSKLFEGHHENPSFVMEKRSECFPKSLGFSAKPSEDSDEHGSMVGGVNEACEEPCSEAFLIEPDDVNNGVDQTEENPAQNPESWCDTTNLKLKSTETESLRILSDLYGKVEGQAKWDKINKTLKEDINQNKFSHKNSFFDFHGPSIRTTLFLVSKIGIPLVIIHMCSNEYGATAVLSRTVLSRIGFCDLSAQSTVTALQVVSAGMSTLLLDKLTNQIVLTSAGVIMSLSLVVLGLLLPSVSELTNDSQPPVTIQLVTPNPALPTLYPLLPTPLPQILLKQKQENICSDNLMKDASFNIWDHEASNIYPHMSSNSSLVWFAAAVLVLYVIVGSLILLPLTRLVLVLSFPVGRRGIGVGVTLSIQWTIRLFLFFLPPSFFTSSVGLIFFSIVSFLSIIMLSCFLSTNQSRYSCLKQTSYGKKFSHLFSYGNICNMSSQSSTAV